MGLAWIAAIATGGLVMGVSGTVRDRGVDAFFGGMAFATAAICFVALMTTGQ